MSTHSAPSVPPMTGSSLTGLLDSSTNLTVLASDTASSSVFLYPFRQGLAERSDVGINDTGGEAPYRPPRATEVPHYRTEPIQTSVRRPSDRTHKKTRGKPWARPVSVYPRETPPRRRRADRAVLLLTVALTELVDATADVQRLLLTGIERVRMARDIELDHRVFVTVFPLDRFLA